MALHPAGLTAPVIRLTRAQDSAPCDPDRLCQRSGAALHQLCLLLLWSRCRALPGASASAQLLCRLLNLSCADRLLAVGWLPGRARRMPAIRSSIGPA